MLKSTRVAVLAVVFATGMTALFSLSAFAQASSPDAIVGVWEEENGNVKFEMYDAGGTYEARVLYGARLVEADGKTFKKDSLNPDPALRSRSLEGTVFLSELRWNARDTRWDGGRLYMGATGRTVSARITLVDETMQLRAFMGTPALGQTMVLRRAAP